MRSNRKALIGTQPIFLLELSWGGKTFHLSSEPIELSSNFGKVYFSGGLLKDLEISFDLPVMGFNVDSYSIPVACFIDGVNISDQIFKGNTFQNSKAELSYIMVSRETIPNYEERIQLIKGKVKQPVYGQPDSPTNYVEFSVEVEVSMGSFYALTIGSGSRLNSNVISAVTGISLSPLNVIFQSGTNKIEVSDVHKGKQLPIVFGTAGDIYDENNQVNRYAVSPAYVLHVMSVGPHTVWLIVAGHAVEATYVRIIDDRGGTTLQPVYQWIRQNGDVFSYVTFNLDGATVANIANDNSIKYFASWTDFGGGYVSIQNESSLTGGGDLCLFCLNRGNLKVDNAAWAAISEVLNAYKFAGYVNNTEISPIELLENEIIPFLPISLIHGNEGIKPILNPLVMEDPLVVASILANEEFTAIGPVETLTDEADLINDYSLKYAHDMRENEFSAIQRCTGETVFYDSTTYTNIYSKKSFLAYGSRVTIEESNFIHDHITAGLVIRDKIKLNAFPVRSIAYKADSKYGYLEVGDVIRLTDQKNSILNNLAQIVSISYDRNNWNLTFRVYADLS